MNEELIEELAALEHEQWITWSKAVADEVGDERRERWEKYWVPYEQLSEDVKEHDRVWARKMILPVLSAIRDGKAKIPGEARRTWLDEFEGYCEEEYGTHQVIILFPEDLACYNEEAEVRRGLHD